MAFTKGEVVVLSATFKSRDGNATNPGTPVNVTIKQRVADADVLGPFATQQIGTGSFQYIYTALTAGRYDYRFTTSDGFIEEGSFVVEPGRVVA